jgi:choice-of-anchor B domain-containing protein
MKYIRFFLLLFCILSARTLHAQTNMNVQFRSNLPYGATVDLSNIWGYVDSLGNEYAIVGTQTGVSIVDVTNPTNPIVKFSIAGTNSFWREVQVWGKYAYVTTEGCCNGLQIINLSNLPASVNSKFWTGSGAVAGQITRIHTVHVRDGYAYLNGSQIFGGAALIVSLADPWNPVYVGNTAMSLSGTSRYVHDCYVKNDTLWGAHIYGGFFSVINIANKTAPVLIATQTTPNNFTHNIWMADNGTKVVFTTDEVSNSYLASYDVSNTGNIQQLDRLQGTPGSGSIIHNTYIRNSYAINSYYKDGITIVDVSRPDNMITVGRYDTYTQGAGNGFNGAWGVYPYLPSGNILVSDIDNGLFVLTPTYIRAGYLEGNVKDSCSNLPLSNVSVTITGGTHHAELSKLNGDYKTGTAVAGLYTVTFSKTGYTSKVFTNVSLQNGQLTSLNVSLKPTTAVNLTAGVPSNVLCNGAATGGVTITTTNGLAPLSYLWSNGATSQQLTNVTAGSYTVTVTDGSGCKASGAFTITQPNAVNAAPTIQQISCNGGSNGVVAALITGGSSPYSYNWSLVPPVQNPSSSTLRTMVAGNASHNLPLSSMLVGDSTGIDSLSAGNYQLVVTDNNGCVSTFNYQLNNPANPCSIQVTLRVFIEGFYTGGSAMNPVLNGAGITDSIRLEVRQSVAPYSLVTSATGLVDTAGYVNFILPSTLWQQSFYFVMRHRNSLETWSKDPVYFPNGTQTFNFSDSAGSFWMNRGIKRSTK